MEMHISLHRRNAREFAFKFLFQFQHETIRKQAETWLSAPDALVSEVKEFERSLEDMPGTIDKVYALELIEGVLSHFESLRKQIQNLSENWDVSRIAHVDLTLLLISCFEIQSREDIPNKVAINEALELAKTFGGPNSVKFLNGILDQFAKRETNGV